MTRELTYLEYIYKSREFEFLVLLGKYTSDQNLSYSLEGNINKQLIQRRFAKA